MNAHKLTNITRSGIRVITVTVMAVSVMVATADGFAQSYSGLYHWALEHQLHGWKAESFPLLVDLFILAGELGLFLLALDGHKITKRFLTWIDLMIPAIVAAIGWSVSLWFNVGHVQNATTQDKVTAGVPPVTAMIGLVILLRTVHRYMAKLDEASNGAVTYDMSRPAIAEEIKDESAPELIVSEHGPVELSAPYVAQERAALDLAVMSQDPPPLAPATAGGTPDLYWEHVNARKSGYATKHPKWDEGVKLYRESLNGAGKPLSQRDLSEALGLKNRSLAAKIMRHVKENENGSG